MLEKFKNMFGPKIASSHQDRADVTQSGRYKNAAASLKSADVKERLTLAADTQTSKEILYYLAEKDPDPEVRKAVAANESMPVQVTPVLASDSDQDVRMALAARLVNLLPELSGDKHSQLYAYAVQSLGTLALDEVLKIRVALSSALKDHAHTPPKVAGKLARDIEREVSEPILRFCAALSDEDLLEILKSHPASWVIQSIAGRKSVSAPVSSAVIDTRDIPGGAALISNDGAVIEESLLQKIVELAREYDEWHKPIAGRKTLPPSVARQLAEFVDASVRDLLMQREDFDEQQSEEIAAIFRRRMDFATSQDQMSEQSEPVEKRLSRLISEGALTEETVTDAIAMRDREFVYGALAHMAGTDVETVEKVMELKAPKSVTALAWGAGLSMRTALMLQKDVSYIAPKELIYPKDGTDYPLSEEDLTWQLEFLGIKS